MTSYLRKYVTALASAKDYIAQWSCEHIFADEELIVPFPTVAIYDEVKKIWSVDIKAWIYLPFHPAPLSNYLPSLPKFITRSIDEKETTKAQESIAKNTKCEDVRSVFNEESVDASTSNVRVDKEKRNLASLVNKENHMAKKADESSEDESEDDDDDMYEEALQEEFGEAVENPGRLGLFFIGNSAKVATKSIINGVEHILNPSDESGFIEQHLELSTKDIEKLCVPVHEGGEDKTFRYHMQVDQKNRKQASDNKNNEYKRFECIIYIPAPNGVSIISDIDDTIKKTHVLSKRALLKHTFYSYFEPIEGMSELYQKWYEQKCQFHYISASPWQLYPALRCFMDKYKFPTGTVDLRRFSWSLEFLRPADTFKMESIVKIVSYYPSRQYICVGDSGELDPEVYALVYEQYPHSIAHILIRDVCGTECPSSCKERYDSVFEKIPTERWTVFKDPKEIPEDINKLLPEHNV